MPLRHVIHLDKAEGEGAAKRALKAVRSHLGLEIAYVSQFVGDRAVFREVDAPGYEAMIKPGDSVSLDDVYCRHILDGRLPEAIPDTAAEPFALTLPITRALPIGAHMSVPIRLPGGETYGMFCCLGPKADASLNERDLKMMRAFADVTAFELAREIDETRARDEKVARIGAAMERDGIAMVYQPIWRLGSARPDGFECLSRFTGEPVRGPDKWFAEAAEVGLGTELELAAIRKALTALPRLPGAAYLTLNASPETIMSAGLKEVLAGSDAARIVLEITEHVGIDDYGRLLAALEPLRRSGVRLAVDDAGAGYSSLQHILKLEPDIIKFDTTLTRDIDTDLARQSLVTALVGFARSTGSEVVAEGVETEAELATLKLIGAQKAQGYLLGRPMPLEQALALFDAPASRTQAA